MKLVVRHSLILAAVFAAVLVMTVLIVPARTNAVGLAADVRCQQSGCTMSPTPGRPLCAQVVCQDITNGFTTVGFCATPTTCKATGTSGSDGFGTQLLQQVLGSLFQKLMQGSSASGSGSGSSAPPPASSSGTTGCTNYYQVTTPTTDPCAYYVPPVSSQLTTGTTNTVPSVSEQLNSITNTNTNTNTNVNTEANTTDALNQLSGQITSVVTTNTTPTSTTALVVPQGAVGGLTSGVSGDVQIFSTGGTILAGSVDTQGNSVTAGFYGSDVYTGQPQGVIADLCRTRPWASNFLSYVLPPSFFDSLCSLRGYQVGIPQPPAPTVTIVQTVAAPVAPGPTTPTTPLIPPSVDIWAVPDSVPLGSRTSVFWTSQGVTSCSVTSPDGSFSQNSLSGGGSTVALTGATTFTISCLAPDGSHVTDLVTVNLSI